MPKFIPENKTREQLYVFAKRHKIGSINSRTKKADLVKVINLYQSFTEKLGSEISAREKEEDFQMFLERQQQLMKIVAKERKLTTRKVKIRDKIVYIDNSIIDIIKNLNNNGYITTNSCSGVRKDHSDNWIELYGRRIASITFNGKNIKDHKKFKEIVENSGWIFEYGELFKTTRKGFSIPLNKPNTNIIFVSLPESFVKAQSDSAILERFRQLEALLIREKGDLLFSNPKNRIGIISKESLQKKGFTEEEIEEYYKRERKKLVEQQQLQQRRALLRKLGTIKYTMKDFKIDRIQSRRYPDPMGVLIYVKIINLKTNTKIQDWVRPDQITTVKALSELIDWEHATKLAEKKEKLKDIKIKNWEVRNIRKHIKGKNMYYKISDISRLEIGKKYRTYIRLSPSIEDGIKVKNRQDFINKLTKIIDDYETEQTKKRKNIEIGNYTIHSIIKENGYYTYWIRKKKGRSWIQIKQFGKINAKNDMEFRRAINKEIFKLQKKKD